VSDAFDPARSDGASDLWGAEHVHAVASLYGDLATRLRCRRFIFDCLLTLHSALLCSFCRCCCAAVLIGRIACLACLFVCLFFCPVRVLNWEIENWRERNRAGVNSVPIILSSECPDQGYGSGCAAVGGRPHKYVGTGPTYFSMLQ